MTKPLELSIDAVFNVATPIETERLAARSPSYGKLTAAAQLAIGSPEPRKLQA